jgi:hypothetical protein
VFLIFNFSHTHGPMRRATGEGWVRVRFGALLIQ